MCLKLPARYQDKTITLAHGAGGKVMHDLIQEVFIATFAASEHDPVASEDQARFVLETLQQPGEQLALTTDSYVVDPLFFPGGDIGKLAVTGTINDLAVGGAKPLYLTCSLIIEEGLPVPELFRVVQSMQTTAAAAGVRIVTGDTKVVPRGAADKLFINTAGVGVIPQGVDIRAGRAQAGDAVLINGFIGDHGAAIVDARGDLALENSIESDCQPLYGLVEAMLAICPDIHCMRDATRGGLATVLNEFARAGGVSIRVEQQAIPLRDEVRGMCEILGLDPLYLANEGKLVAVVPAAQADELLAVMQQHPAGQYAAMIGTVKAAYPGRVIMATGFGGDRLIDMLTGEQLPRIC